MPRRKAAKEMERRIEGRYALNPFEEVVRAYRLRERWDNLLSFESVEKLEEDELAESIERSLLLYTASYVLREHWRASLYSIEGRWEKGEVTITADTHGVEALRRFAVHHATLLTLKAPYVGMTIKGLGWKGDRALLFLTFQGKRGIKANPYFRKLRALLKGLEASIFMLNPSHNPYCHEVPCAFPKAIYEKHFEGEQPLFLLADGYPLYGKWLPAFAYAFYPLFPSWQERVMEVFTAVMEHRRRKGLGREWYGNAPFLFPSLHRSWLEGAVVGAAPLRLSPLKDAPPSKR